MITSSLTVEYLKFSSRCCGEDKNPCYHCFMQHHTGNPQQDLVWSKILSKKRVKSKVLGILCPIEMSENNITMKNCRCRVR